MFSRMVLTFYSSQFLSIHCSIFAHKTRALVDTFVFFFYCCILYSARVGNLKVRRGLGKCTESKVILSMYASSDYT